MIFVTVGTHEQPFNRLIQKVDELKRDGVMQRIANYGSFLQAYIKGWNLGKEIF